jgi:hypothetical protein
LVRRAGSQVTGRANAALPVCSATQRRRDGRCG